jgi:hypothetical protein
VVAGGPCCAWQAIRFLARKSKTGETLTFKNDGHWNSTGHQAVAEVLSDYLSTHPAK